MYFKFRRFCYSILLYFRLAGSPVMVLPSTVQPCVRLKPISTAQMVRGRLNNILSCLYLFFCLSLFFVCLASSRVLIHLPILPNVPLLPSLMFHLFTSPFASLPKVSFIYVSLVSLSPISGVFHHVSPMSFLLYTATLFLFLTRPLFFLFTTSVRCMEHSLHLAAKHFVKTVSPISPASIRKKTAAALKMAREGLCLDEAEYDKALFSVDHDYDVNDDGESDGSGPEPDDWDEDLCFSPGDSLGKALALVKQ